MRGTPVGRTYSAILSQVHRLLECTAVCKAATKVVDTNVSYVGGRGVLSWCGPQPGWRMCFCGLPALRTEHLVCFLWALLQPLPDGLTPALHHHYVIMITSSSHISPPTQGSSCARAAMVVPAGIDGYTTSMVCTSRVCELHAVRWPRGVICTSLLAKPWGPMPELPLPISSDLLSQRLKLSDCASRHSDISVQSATTHDALVYVQGLTCGAWLSCIGNGWEPSPRESIAASRLKSMGSVSGRSSRLIWLACACRHVYGHNYCQAYCTVAHCTVIAQAAETGGRNKQEEDMPGCCCGQQWRSGTAGHFWAGAAQSGLPMHAD